jgi:NNP family nitrate/nitrite transporter-like MFS transporter
LFRPVGGWLADRWGGIRILNVLFVLLTAILTAMAALPALAPATALLFVVMASFGMGNGAVFQLVPQRFKKEIGAVTGLVGAAGGLGGFLLPAWFGLIKDGTGGYAMAFLGLACAPFTAMIILALARGPWQRSFVGAGGRARTLEAATLPT